MKVEQNDIFETLPVKISTGELQLSPITLRQEYRQKWQVSMSDFVVLTKDGELINNSLFRVGGLGFKDIRGKNYFMLLKYKEAFYSNDILKMSGSKKKEHLQGNWCIVDKNGVIKFEAPEFNHPWIIDNSCIYKFKDNYYNIETGYFYGSAFRSVESKNFLFLENNYDKDLSRRGVIKINKQTGEYEIL